MTQTLLQRHPRYYAPIIGVPMPLKQGRRSVIPQTPEATNAFTLIHTSMEVLRQDTMCLTPCILTPS